MEAHQQEPQVQAPNIDAQVEKDYDFENDPSNFVYPEFETEDPPTTGTDPGESKSQETQADDIDLEDEKSEDDLSGTTRSKSVSEEKVDYSKYKDLFSKTKRLEADVSFYKNQLERLNQQIHSQVQRIQELEAAQANQTAHPNPTIPGQMSTLQAPKLENYQDYDQYNRDVARYEAQLVIDQAFAKHMPTQMSAADIDLRTRAEKSKQMIDNQLRIDKKFNENTYVPEPLLKPLAGSDKIIEILYYFGKNKSVADRIAHLPPDQIIREIGRLEGKLPPINGVKPRKTSKAPRGVTSPEQSASLSTKNPADMTVAELKKFKAAGGYSKKLF